MNLALQYTIDALNVGGLYALMALGIGLIFGIMRLINFAHGSVYMIGAYVGWFCVIRLALPLLPTFAIVTAACALCGLLIERFALRPLRLPLRRRRPHLRSQLPPRHAPRKRQRPRLP